ncbi:hypothetical protein M9458_000897, partial [Cirrhinus mrigala]
MLSLKERDRPIVRKLCVLRFCCVGTSSAYRRSYEDIHEELLAFISEENSPQSHGASGEDKPDDPPNKRMRIDEGSTEDSVTPAQTDSDICPDFCDLTFAKQ